MSKKDYRTVPVSCKKSQWEEEYAANKTLSKDEIMLLQQEFQKQVNSHSDKMNQNIFQELMMTYFDITDAFLTSRVFKVMDQDNDGFLSLAEWLKGMAFFLRADTKQKVPYCFKIYDLNDDGYITAEEIRYLLRSSFPEFVMDEDLEEASSDLTDIIIKLMDYDKDGKISLLDYQQAAADQYLLVESFGQCFPEKKLIKEFFTKLQSKWIKVDI